MREKFPYKWKLSELPAPAPDAPKVFSCFACGGGSSMGYKLAGYNVIGGNEIDLRMARHYVKNLKPKYLFVEPIQEFKLRDDLPRELYNLDVLDGSPPCSTFSMAGNREKDWGRKKHFREGQQAQVLDTLFFDFIDLAKKLRPKVVIAENVKGMLIGEAVDYVIRIREELEEAGYYVQHFLLNAAKMGVPQRRERVFFLCLRKDIAEPVLQQATLFEKLPKIDMDFKGEEIPFGEIADEEGDPLQPAVYKLWKHRCDQDTSVADASIRTRGKRAFFNYMYAYRDRVCPTITAHAEMILHVDTPRQLSKREVVLASTFPVDYDFGEGKTWGYICGMSVPPVMMAQIASRVREQWLDKIEQD